MSKDNVVLLPQFDRKRERMTYAETLRVFRDARYADPRGEDYFVIYKPTLNKEAIGLFLRSEFTLSDIMDNITARTRALSALARAHPVYYPAVFHAAVEIARTRPVVKGEAAVLGYRDVEAAVRQGCCDPKGEHDLTAKANADMLEGVSTFIWLTIAAAVLDDVPVGMTYRQMLERLAIAS